MCIIIIIRQVDRGLENTGRNIKLGVQLGQEDWLMQDQYASLVKDISIGIQAAIRKMNWSKAAGPSVEVADMLKAAYGEGTRTVKNGKIHVNWSKSWLVDIYKERKIHWYEIHNVGTWNESCGERERALLKVENWQCVVWFCGRMEHNECNFHRIIAAGEKKRQICGCGWLLWILRKLLT